MTHFDKFLMQGLSKYYKNYLNFYKKNLNLFGIFQE
jgi:hypothetical protein